VPRTVAGVGQTVPMMRIDTHGYASPFGRMVLLEGGGVWLDEADGVSQKHDGLPWFLDDMRPQGFIGRTFAYAHPELQLGTDPQKWNADDVLRAMVLFGEDLPGNLIVGDTAFAASNLSFARFTMGSTYWSSSPLLGIHRPTSAPATCWFVNIWRYKPCPPQDCQRRKPSCLPWRGACFWNLSALTALPSAPITRKVWVDKAWCRCKSTMLNT
jgi:hypothetical protein